MVLAPPATPSRPSTPPKRLVGPGDLGRRMTLEEFDAFESREGERLELSRGFIDVSDVPSIDHSAHFEAVRDPFVAYRLAHPGIICRVLGGGEAKTIISETESERHPDLSVYLTPPPPGPQPWGEWVPDIVVEIVSESSVRRDYREKREDYWDAGVREYLIGDGFRGQVQVHRRGPAGWLTAVLDRGDRYTTDLLPGFDLACGPVLDAT